MSLVGVLRWVNTSLLQQQFLAYVSGIVYEIAEKDVTEKMLDTWQVFSIFKADINSAASRFKATWLQVSSLRNKNFLGKILEGN